jgi:hypothetical protein
MNRNLLLQDALFKKQQNQQSRATVHKFNQNHSPWSYDSSVGIVTGYGLDSLDSFPGRVWNLHSV